MKHPLLVAGWLIVLVIFMAPLEQPHYFSNSNNKTDFMIPDTVAPVKLQLEKTNFKDMTVLFIKDTAFTTPAIQKILGNGYGELMQFTRKNQLQPLKFMAWYYAMMPPWPVDIAIETDKAPAELTGRIQSRIQPGGEVLIAHMSGPYDQVGQAYEQIESWLKENKRKAKGHPFEVYINDPNSVKDPSEIRTDVYQPID
jgi:effector-binding domain-containing protein